MSNLRLKRIKVIGNGRIRAQFTANLDTLINTSNIDVEPIVIGIPKPEVLKVNIKNDIIDIYTQPLTPYSNYILTFKSSSTQFKSINGTDYLLEDGTTNAPIIQGIPEPPNNIKLNLLELLKDNILNLDGSTLASKVIDAQSNILSKALHDIGQMINDNYLEVLIKDEKKVRGLGAFDRLNEEGAFEIIRVGLTTSDNQNVGNLSYTDLPSSLISLQRADIYNETLVAGTAVGTFNGLILNVRNSPVIKIKSLTFVYNNGNQATYDINRFGYQIKENKYDNYASKLLTLEDNQFKLSDQLLESDIIPPVSGDRIIISYEYKDLGKVIESNTVVVSQILDSTREPAPPIVNEFSTTFFPIVLSNDIIPTTEGIQFLDPRCCNPFNDIHPAFVREIPYNLNMLPSREGEYSVDYENGRIFVYGNDGNNGTGYFPPAMTYKYRRSFIKDLDYTYNPETFDLAASPLRDLVGEDVKITFNYTKNLVPGLDYNCNVHNEIIDERIQNRLLTLNSLRVLNTPVTNVFRIFNETVGELYQIIRFSDNNVYFSGNQLPRIEDASKETCSFYNVLNETLFINQELTNSSSIDIFQLNLANNRIISSTEDCIGSSFNSSVDFSRKDIFATELYFDDYGLTVSENINKLINIGEYTIDYANGIVYVAVAEDQVPDLGVINYKKSYILPNNPHVTSVADVYYNFDSAKIEVDYSNFDDTEIIPINLEKANERFVNGNIASPFMYIDGQITVTDNVEAVRHIFDVYDLNNNNAPTDFAEESLFENNIITPGTVRKTENYVIESGSIINANYISPGIEISSIDSIIRISDGYNLYDSNVSFVSNTITVPSGVVGDVVQVNYRVTLNGASTPVIDYSRGNLCVDYEYLADEILVSYEYGDNCIDFRESTTVDTNTTYYVTYKVGALRDSLFSNFGTLVDLPIMNTFDTSFDREKYRDALQGALQSFTKGPTIPSMKKLVSSVTKTDPEIIEAIFDIWSLGISNLYQNMFNVTGDIQLLPGKFDNGVYLENNGDSLTIPAESNLKINEGTLEFWTVPSWDGLDNDAQLTFSGLTKDGYYINSNDIYIGAAGYHPEIIDNEFSLKTKSDIDINGIPFNIYTDTGIFIYYDVDIKKWNFVVKDTFDGYIYAGKIYTSGEFYNVKPIENTIDLGDSLRSLTNEIEFTFSIDSYDSISPDGYSEIDGYIPGYSFDGMTFMSDNKHYFIDLAKDKTKDRFSIYKDGRGYLNFEVFDSYNRSYKVSSDISNWLAGQKHHIATSWKIDTFDERDELHLFVDGVEVPNILRYGGRPIASLSDRFRTVKPEIVLGTITRPIIKGSDLITTIGSNVVTGNVNFQAAGIVPGDTIYIIEDNFGLFNITYVDGQTLALDSTVSASLDDARYCTNMFSAIVSDEVILSPNVSVNIYDGYTETEIPGQRADFPSYSVDKNIYFQTVLNFYGPADIGDQLYIRTLGLNHKRCRESVYLWSDQNIIKTKLPPPINLDEVNIIPVILPLVNVNPTNATVVGSDFVLSGLVPTSVSNTIEGRKLNIRITGGNVNFTNPVSVVITGTSDLGITETITFTAPSSVISTSKWMTITDVTVTVTPYSLTSPSISIEITEAYSVTNPDGNSTFPLIRYSFQNTSGTSLTSDGYGVISGGYFSSTNINDILVITSPLAAAGAYTITEITDETHLVVSPAPIAFTSGEYKIYNMTITRSGFNNGFFTFEVAGQIGIPYNLPSGMYKFDYASYLKISFENIDQNIFVGSDFESQNQSMAVIDELRILSRMITDTRVGETIPSGGKSITSDAITILPFESDNETLLLAHFDNEILTNSAGFYKIATEDFMQSSDSVNTNFSKSLLVNEYPYVIDNRGYLNTSSEGTIEFWVSPQYDAFNDPNYRYYFDATSAIVEEVTSITNSTLKLDNRVYSVDSIRLITDENNTGTNYFEDAQILNDYKTIKLNKLLPYQRTPVKVAYVPSGFSGDRISIFKDSAGYLNFRVIVDGEEYNVRQPIFWQRNSWHRIMVSYKFNRRDNRDEMRLFIDGREYGTILFGQGLIFGTGFVFGQGAENGISRLIANIDFSDNVNKIFIGSDYRKSNIAMARFDNIKFSNISRAPILCSGIYIDENYQTNTEAVYPVIPDLYTTYLMNFDTLVEKNEDFSILRDEYFGIFNFIINIIDSFDIISEDQKANNMLTELIYALKPAQSKVEINVLK